jgi:hypothetical protein
MRILPLLVDLVVEIVFKVALIQNLRGLNSRLDWSLGGEEGLREVGDLLARSLGRLGALR